MMTHPRTQHALPRITASIVDMDMDLHMGRLPRCSSSRRPYHRNLQQSGHYVDPWPSALATLFVLRRARQTCPKRIATRKSCATRSPAPTRLASDLSAPSSAKPQKWKKHGRRAGRRSMYQVRRDVAPQLSSVVSLVLTLRSCCSVMGVSSRRATAASRALHTKHPRNCAAIRRCAQPANGDRPLGNGESCTNKA